MQKKLFTSILIFCLSYSCVTNETESVVYLNEGARKVEYKGLTMTLPENWELKNSVLMDTVENIKKGEFAPGIVTPKKGTFSGSDFIYELSAKNQIDFEETKVSFDGMPREILNTDSIFLGNAKWYYGTLKYEEHANVFTYEHLYYGEFERKGVMMSFYSQEIEKQDTMLYNKILGSIEILEN